MFSCFCLKKSKQGAKPGKPGIVMEKKLTPPQLMEPNTNNEQQDLNRKMSSQSM